MNVLVIDGGGRGQAWAWKLRQSSRVEKMYIAPGNGGSQKIGAENVAIKVDDVEGLLRFAKQESIGFTAALSDDSLAAGVVDAFQAQGLRIFGPTRLAAEIESSKVFAKQLMVDTSVPTAKHRVFTRHEEALVYIFEHGAPIVVKASGLALGKGAYVCRTVEEAEEAIDEIMVKRAHKKAGDMVVIEDFLKGPEVSIHAWCDGTNFSLFPSGQDHKPAFDGDNGPNTGGMGTIAPVPWFSADALREVGEKIVGPVLKELARQGRPFVGCLYPGLKITPSGPKVLEINARPGDTETQTYMRLLKTDLLDIMEACVNGTLAKCRIEWNSGFATCIALASGGYPGPCEKGFTVTGIEDAEKIPGVIVFHAGTKMENGLLKTSGGRVLGVSAFCDNLRGALQIAYFAAEHINFKDRQYRRDIGASSLELARRMRSLSSVQE